MEVTIQVHQEGPGYWAAVEELPGCFASGRTLNELGDALDEAIGLWLDADGARVRRHPLRVGEQGAEVVF